VSHAANLRSLNALREFRVALVDFIDKARRSLTTADAELQRVSGWLIHEQPAHWQREIRKGEERLAQAKSELFRATISQPNNPRGPVDQKRLVAKRKAEIEHARKKLEATKRWSRTLERGGQEYRGLVGGLASSLDGDLKKAAAKIERAVASLEAYMSTTPSTYTSPEVPLVDDPSSIARKGDTPDEHADSQGPTDQGDEEAQHPLE
jgi:hypothetical protein